MIKYFTFFISVATFGAISAQSVAPQVVNATGGDFKNNDFSLEWSLGEVSISTLQSNGNFLSEGFLQPNLPGSVATIDLADNPLDVFPNPFNQWIRLVDQNQPDARWNVKIFNALGMPVMVEQAANELYLANLSSGIYVLQVSDLNNKFIKSIKISKYN